MKIYSRLLSLTFAIGLMTTFSLSARDCIKKQCCPVGSYVGVEVSDQGSKRAVQFQFHDDGLATISLFGSPNLLLVGEWKCLRQNCIKFCTKQASLEDAPSVSYDGEICFSEDCDRPTGKAIQTTILDGKPTPQNFTLENLERVTCSCD